MGMKKFTWDQLSILDVFGTKQDIETKDKHGRTPLFYACSRGRLMIVEELIRLGADIEARDESGWTPLMVACTGGYLDIVKILTQAGANVEAASTFDWQPLICAAHYKHLHILQFLLDAGANINGLFFQSKSEFLRMLPWIKEVVEKNIQKLTPENAIKWKTHRMKTIFM